LAILGFDSYADAERSFKWKDRWKLFDRGPDEFNLVDQGIDRFVRSGRGSDVAARVAHRDASLEEFTYEELSVGSARVAAQLRRRGVVKGTPVLIAVDPGVAWLTAQLACLRIGAPIVPASAVVGAQTILNRIAASEAKVVILDEQAQEEASAVRSSAPDCLVLHDAEVSGMAVDGSVKGDWAIDAHGSDAAVFVYSSGTTGRPKRTSMSHRSFTFNATLIGKFVLDLQPEDRYLKAGSTAWGGAFSWGVVTPLLMGTAAGIYSGAFDARALLDQLTAARITAMWAPPTALRRLISKVERPLPHLSRIAYAGEAAGRELAPLVQATLGAELRGHYGATEIGMLAVDYAFADYQQRPGSAGKPVFGIDVSAIDDNDSRLPDGAHGAIAVRRNEHWLRTGDLGYLDDDNYLWVTGRADDVIISSGYTIGPDEVEEALRSHPSVYDAAVVGIPDDERGTLVKAFIQLRDQSRTPDRDLERELAETVRSTVGRYAYPRSFQFVDEIPRSDAGKVQRNQLRRSERAA
jgi:acetyl-CoA synthetase